jgi:hypothetical protein
MKGYKVFNPDWTCQGYDYKQGGETAVGTTHEMQISPVVCSTGFHGCLKLNDCFNYYPFNPENKVAEVEFLGEIQKHDDDSKIATNKIHIVRELTWHEVLDAVNVGKNNTGRDNTGYFNTGDRNTGYRNTGDFNTGYRNTGDRNTGDRNTGNCNTGNCNTGDRNTGNCNTGNCNTGDRNTGDRNTGYRNTGYFNTGDRNTGDRNTGNCNTGNCNTGNCNTGDFNSCDFSAGVFCTQTPKLLIFDKPTNMTYLDWRNSDAFCILSNLTLTQWIDSSEMCQAEKDQHPEYKTLGGYLKRWTYQEAWKNLWDKLSDRQKKVIFDIPNFDKDKFRQITGLEVK